MARFAVAAVAGLGVACTASPPQDPVPVPPVPASAAQEGGPTPARLPPRRLPLAVTSHGLYLPAQVGGVDVFLTLDTASWFTRIPVSLAAKIGAATAGWSSASVVLGSAGRTMDLGSRSIAILDGGDDGVVYPDLPTDRLVAGTAGNDLFADWMLGIDYAQGEVWLEESPTSTAVLPSHPDGTKADPWTVAAERPRGKDGRDKVGIVVLPCSFANGAPVGRCMLDTGSPPDVALTAAWDAAPHAHRHRIPTFATDFTGALLRGFYQRADALAMGPVREEGAPVVVFDRFPVLEDEGAYFGIEFAGLVGNTTLSGYFTVIDYPAGRVVLFPYEPRRGSGVLGGDAEFLGHGFVLGAAKGGGVEITVIEGSLAKQSGLRTGDTLMGIEGTYLLSSYSSIVKDAPGARRAFDVVRADGTRATLTSTAEDVLPR